MGVQDLNELQVKGLLSLNNGRIQIVDRKGLQAIGDIWSEHSRRGPGHAGNVRPAANLAAGKRR